MTKLFSRFPWPETAILLLAVALRLAFLDIKPAHFDEGVNGWFADRMTETGFYHYDPTNYHGPLHFYAVFLSQTLFGRNLWALRLPAIVASVLCVWAMLRLGRFFGPTAARLAALAMAVSPGFVFYGRYSIHESWVVLFSIGFLYGLIGLWKSGDRRSLYMACLAATGLVLVKETYILHLGSFALAALTLWLWQMVVPSRPAEPLAPRHWTGRDLAGGLAVSLGLIVFFYSGNFLDFAGLRGLYQTFGEWFHTGVHKPSGHEKEAYDFWPIWGKTQLNYYWLALMTRYEIPALCGLIACLRFVLPSSAPVRFTAIYGSGVLLAYSIIPYKTPWCIISMLWPFYLVLGALLSEASEALWNRLRFSRAFFATCATILILLSLLPSLRLNFREFTNEKEPYVYVQTHQDVATLLDPLLEGAKRDPSRYHLRGQFLLDSYYPLPWIFGDFTQLGYYKVEEPPPAFDGDFIVAEVSKRPAIEAQLKEPYYVRQFRLRDSQEECVVFFRHALFQEWFEGAAPEIRGGTP